MTNTAPLFEVRNAGLLALVIDAGRVRQQHKGACVAGPMDTFAYTMTNILLERSNGKAIEIFGGGFELVVATESIIVVTGLGGQVTVNGAEIKRWLPHQVVPDDVLAIAPSDSGYISYLAFSHELKSGNAYGSFSTVMREGIGGLNSDGTALASGDRVFANVHEQIQSYRQQSEFKLILPLVKKVYQPRPIRLTPGNQANALGKIAWNRMLASSYQVLATSNRMGIRLSGDMITQSTYAMRSEGVSLGTVQVPPDGQPIVLMAERQTLGGYPKIANVAQIDLPLLAQCQAGTIITFIESDTHTARNELRLLDLQIQQMRKT